MAKFVIKKISPKKKIKARVMELFETADDLKKFFNSILPKNSLLKSLLKIDDYADKEEICDVVLSYLGDNFFVYVGKIRSDEVDFEGETITKSRYNNMKKIIQKSEQPSPEIREQFVQAIKKYESSTKINPAHIVREKFLEQLCLFHNNNPNKKQELIEGFNKNQKDKNKVSTIKELSQSKNFLSKSWAKDLCNKDLLLPEIIIEKPETEPQLPETIALRKRNYLPRLYDFQTEALIKIHSLFNDSEDREDRQKRLLVNLPTGAGKTRMTVQAIVEWLNLRDRNECQNAHEQQLNENGIIFWFASTNELCTQASDEFQQIFDHIGTAGQINLTNWFGSNRRDLRNILDDKPGIHIVITNTIHTNKKFKHFRDTDAGKYKYDQFRDHPELIALREKTIAIIIDEAHEVTGEGYLDFLAAMGFDYSPNKRGLEKKLYNTQNIVLIGLTATPYKGSGITQSWKCKTCSKILENSIIKKNHENRHTNHQVEKLNAVFDDGFAEDDNVPDYFKTLDPKTRQIHRIFGGVFLPIPNRTILDSLPTAIIDVPLSAHIGDEIKISGRNSYDQYSELDFKWEISTFEKMIYESKISPERKSDHPEIYQKFIKDGDYSVRLTVTNRKNVSSQIEQKIRILPREKTKIKRTGDLEDTKEFYDILTNDQKILCKITHGVIEGPQTTLSKAELKKWRMGTLENEDGKISNDEIYNKKICDIVDKCIKDNGKKRVLIFANGVKHSQELMLILRIKYGYKKAESVDGATNPGIRRRIVKEFRNGEIPILCNFGVLTTGFDVPKIDTVIIARDVGSNALYTQMIGRGQRGPKPGGTDELWLITSNFPHQVDPGEDLQLGWEALAENWQKFSEEQKKNLGVIDFEYKTSSEKPRTEIKKYDFIQKIEPIQDLRLKCQICGVISNGLKNSLAAYGYKSKNIDDEIFQNTVKKYLKENKFHKNCKYCRDITKLVGESKCEFTNYVAKNHKLDPIFVLIIKYIYSSQSKNKFTVNWKILKNDFEEDLFSKGVPNDFITHNMPLIKKLEDGKILKIKNNLDVEFLKIDDFETCKKIIDVLWKNPSIEKKLEEIINKNKTSKITNKEINELDLLYHKLKRKIGHIPTKRQFTTSLDEQQKNQFSNQFSNNYEKFLSIKREFLKDDGNLKDSLYDEYFQKCLDEKSKISHKELDETGDYRLSDYKDMWTTVEKFEKKVEPILIDVLKNYDELQEKRQSEFELISKDIQELKKKRPSDYYHFETIRQHSKVRIFRYIAQLKISHLRFLQNYDGKEPGIFLQLLSDFFRLKEWVQTTPTKDEFTKLTLPLSTSNLMRDFGIGKKDYERFLEMISVEPFESTDIEHREIMQDFVINDLKEFSKKYDKEKTLEKIDLPFDPNDKLSVQIEMYFPDRKKLKKILFPVNSNIEP